jgi:transcriptional regulator with GAF, ATPase, and Fis domain
MEARIVGIAGLFQGSIFAVPEGEVSIGRDSTNQIYLADASLSRRHCLLLRQGVEVRVRDLGSRNGTRVNSVPVAEQQLQHGDQLSVGASLFVILLEQEGATPSSPVRFDDTSAITGAAVLLPREDTLFPLRDQPMDDVGTPRAGRLTADLNALLKMATAIGSIQDRDSLQWQLLGFVFDVVPAERGSVLFFDAQGEVSSTTAWDRIRGPEQAVPVSQAVLQRVLRERAGLVVTDVRRDETLQPAATGKETQSGSLLCVPMVVGERVLGVIYLDSQTPTVQFDRNHLQVLQAVAHISALALENINHWEKLKQENQTLKAEISLKHDMVGSSPKVREVFEFVRRVAPTDATVLIEGESGTGKELVARAIHRNSERGERPFMAINCAAITESLLESELFGHEKGAFTGAVSQKKGKVEVAEGGTLFLDEISELALGLQAKLLRVLQEREFERVGGTRAIPLDIRLVAATNKNLSRAVEAGEFRKDLFYRLNVVRVTMPPLRERREDISELASHFIEKTGRKSKAHARAIAPEALECLKNYDWPGNVRELENAIERALVMGSSDKIGVDDLPEAIIEAGTPLSLVTGYHSALKEVKKQLIQKALLEAGGSYLDAAKALGLHPNSLLRLMRNLNVKAAAKSTAPPAHAD